MFRYKYGLLVAATFMAATTAADAQKVVYFGGSPTSGPERIFNQYICVFAHDAVLGSNVRGAAMQMAVPEGGSVRRVYTHALRGFSVNISAEGVTQMLRRNPRIQYCEQDQVMRLEPIIAAPPPGRGPGGGGSGDTGGTTPTEEIPWGVQRVNGGIASYTGSNCVWIIDTGIDAGHPELNVDAGHSRSFGRDTSDWNDNNGHGTHVSGTIGAKKNGEGVVGVAPGAKVVAVRVLERNGSGSYSNVIAGVDYVAANSAICNIANMSLGGPGSEALDSAVRGAASAGVRFTIAAGNSSADANNYSPARVEWPGVYTVSAFKKGDIWSSFSNYGNPPIEYGEPGQSITSTWKDGGYNTISGTSMAAPHLAGILVLGGAHSDGTVSGDPDGNPDPIGIH